MTRDTGTRSSPTSSPTTAGRLLRTACLVTGDAHLGEDLLQTALAKAYGSWAKVRAADHPVAYVRRLMINAHLSWLRRLTNTERVLETFHDIAF